MEFQTRFIATITRLKSVVGWFLDRQAQLGTDGGFQAVAVGFMKYVGCFCASNLDAVSDV
jgi:hypothetical protein